MFAHVGQCPLCAAKKYDLGIAVEVNGDVGAHGDHDSTLAQVAFCESLGSGGDTSAEADRSARRYEWERLDQDIPRAFLDELELRRGVLVEQATTIPQPMINARESESPNRGSRSVPSSGGCADNRQ